MLLYAPSLRETVQEASWQTRKKPVKIRFAVVLRTRANTAALRVRVLGIRLSLIAIADMKSAVETSKNAIPRIINTQTDSLRYNLRGASRPFLFRRTDIPVCPLYKLSAFFMNMGTGRNAAPTGPA